MPIDTPRSMKFIESVFEKLKRHPKRIVFPEGAEPRVLRAAARFVKLKLGAPVLLGNKTEIEKTALAEGVSLAAAYPNPFREYTTLRFSMPTQARATLRIHDLAGRLVRTVVDSELKAGAQSATWDARDDRGIHVAGGTYFARLMVGGKIAYRTMILVH